MKSPILKIKFKINEILNFYFEILKLQIYSLKIDYTYW